VGTVLDGKFVVGNVLGAPGGFGIAYLGWDRVLQRKVVIKELFPDGLVSRAAGSTSAVDPIQSSQRAFFNLQRELFLDEARKLARLDGVDAVARVIHYFAENDTAYFVMPHVPGTSLAQRVHQAGRLPADQVLHYVWPLAQGLQAIHDLGLVHRDIKPENVLVDERERPVLIDFGNATVMDMGGSTRHNFFAVSRCFAAPEQYVNDLSRTGPWTDIYALGALIYFCLTGQRPTDSAVRAAGGELPPLAQLAPDLPQALLDAVDRAMAMDPTQRPATVPEFLALLEPLRPQAFHWTQALPANPFGQRMHRVHEQVGRASTCRATSTCWPGCCRASGSLRTAWCGRAWRPACSCWPAWASGCGGACCPSPGRWPGCWPPCPAPGLPTCCSTAAWPRWVPASRSPTNSRCSRRGSWWPRRARRMPAPCCWALCPRCWAC
jgi:serine/threonine protein kinase